MYRLLDKCIQRYERGFTLVETLLAIFILLIAITGPLSVSYQSIKYVRFAADRAIATMLAQDAMEYIVAKKNYNIASGLYWMEDLDPEMGQKKCKHDEKGCSIDTSFPLDDPGAIIKCTGLGCGPLKHDGQYYGHSGTDDTKYVRTITIETPTINPTSSENDNERIIKVKVEYSSGIFSDSYELRLNVFNSNV